MKEQTFTLAGAYQFADTFPVANDDPFIYAEAGRLSGAWQWTFGDGSTGSTHVNGATANRITAQGAELFGTMKINMFEMDGSPRDQDLLFLAYRSTRFEVEGSKVTIDVEGEFIGGVGRYVGASGTLKVTSVNGFIGKGGGTLLLSEEVKSEQTSVDQVDMSETDVEAAVNAYFTATQSGDATQWAARFGDDAVVEDPVGQPVLRSREAILRQGEQFMASFEEVGLYPEFIQVSGNRASAKWTGRGQTKDGRRVEFEGVNVWEFASDGRVQKLTGYWDPSKMVEIA